MAGKELVSIIIPCYNCEGTLKKCVDSILDQIYRNIEIVLVDDGSNDSTSSLCDSFSAMDIRIKTIHKENGGLVSSWKAGVRSAKGKYIAFCDSDDYVDEDFIQNSLKAANESNADIVTFDAIAEYPDNSKLQLKNSINHGLYCGEKLKEIKNHLLFNGKMQSQLVLNSRWSKLYKKSILLSCLDDISDNLTNGEDAATTYVTIMRAERIFNMSGFAPYHYCRNDSSMIGKQDSEWFMKMVILREELIKNAAKYGRDDLFQIDNFSFSNILMFAKKEIVRNKSGRVNVTDHLSEVRESCAFEEIMNNVDVKNYSLFSRIFADLFIKRKMTLLYYMTKCAALMGYGKQ